MKLTVLKLLQGVLGLAIFASGGLGLLFLLGAVIAFLTGVFNGEHVSDGTIEVAFVFLGFFVFFMVLCALLMWPFNKIEVLKAAEEEEQAEGKKGGSGCLVWLVILVIGVVAALALLSPGPGAMISQTSGHLPHHAVPCAAPSSAAPW